VTRYRADAVVTVDEAGSVHRPGVLDVEGGRITWVGPATGAPPRTGPEVVLGGLVMPGLVNTHAHTPMTLVRGAGDGLPLERWLHDVVWPREARFTDEDVHWGMLLGCQEMLRCGVTTTAEVYLRARVVAGAALEAGIRCVLAPAVFSIPGAGPEATWQHALDEAAGVHADFDGRDGRLTVGIGPHSAYALPVEGLAASARVAAELGALVQIHVAETAAEERAIRAEHGCGSPELLERLGVLDGRVLAAHSVWLDDADLDRFAEHDVAVAHCPQSNGKLGSGVARLGDLLARGIRVGLGTDGPASNDNLDLWEEMRLAPLLARGVAADPALVPTAQALRLATRGGAEALGLETGCLAPGRPADFIRLDLDDATFVPTVDQGDLLAHLVWAASSRLVTDVWVAGRPVVVAGRGTTVDGAEARRQVTARAHRLGQATPGGSAQLP
jgi:5-methylthioadenosine/S-adenosylhomocysteine deaminase